MEGERFKGESVKTGIFPYLLVADVMDVRTSTISVRQLSLTLSFAHFVRYSLTV